MTSIWQKSATDCVWERHHVCFSRLLRFRFVNLLFILLVFLGLVHMIGLTGRFSIFESHHFHEFIEIIVLSSACQHARSRGKFSEDACLTNNGCCFTIKFQQTFKLSLVHLAK